MGFECDLFVCVCVCVCVRLTRATEGFLSGDALVAGRAERGSGHGERVEEVAITVARLSLSCFFFPLPHALLLFILIEPQKLRINQSRLVASLHIYTFKGLQIA